MIRGSSHSACPSSLRPTHYFGRDTYYHTSMFCPFSILIFLSLSYYLIILLSYQEFIYNKIYKILKNIFFKNHYQQKQDKHKIFKS
jgi:hypothetical protein